MYDIDMVILCLLYLLLCNPFVVNAIPGCYRKPPLGMRNGAIQNNQFSSSIEYLLSTDPGVRDEQARLDEPSAWCTASSHASGEWITVSFGETTKVTGIAIQGQQKNKDTMITRFKIEYSTSEQRENFKYFQTFDGMNVNAPVTTYRWFDRALELQHFRFVIQAVHEAYWITTHGCLRFELYGCSDEADYLTPLGMETGMIKDGQLSGITDNSGETFARLFDNRVGLYSERDKPLELKISLEKPMLITGFSMQGGLNHQYRYSYVAGLDVHIFNETSETSLLIGQFTNSWLTGYQSKFFKFDKPWVAKNIRFTKTFVGQSSSSVLKVELYGTDPVLNTSLRHRSFGSEDLKAFADIHTMNKTCVNLNETVNIQLSRTVFMSGFLFQGDPTEDNWVKSITLKYDDFSENKNEEVIISGCKSRVAPLAVYWPKKHILTNHLSLVMNDCKGKCCFRMDIRGSDEVFSAPESLQLFFGVSDLFVIWKEPTVIQMPLKNYQIVLNATKPYDDTFNIVLSDEVETVQFIYKPTFVAAKVKVTVFAVASDKIKSGISEVLIIQPKRPPAPKMEENGWSENFSKGSFYKFYTVNDTHGPISAYETFVSENGDLNNKRIRPISYEDAHNSGKGYFIGARVSRQNVINSSLTYNVTDGIETVPNLNGRIKTFGSFHLCTRAVILGKDIVSYGFKKRNYYGEFSCQKLDRNTLKKLPAVQSTSEGLPIVSIPHQKGIIYYQIIVSQYTNGVIPQVTGPLQAYNSNSPGSPYVAGVLYSKSSTNTSSFILGDGKNYTLNSTATNRVRRETLIVYTNVKLKPNTEYIASVRGFTENGDGILSPWSSSFVTAKEVITTTTTTTTTTTVAPVKEESSGSNSTTIGIIVAVIFLLLIIIIVVIFFIRKKRTGKRKYVPSYKKNVTVSISDNNSIRVVDRKKSSKAYFGVKTEALSLASLEKRACAEHIQLSKSAHNIHTFPKYYQDQKDNMHLDLIRQFQSIPFCKKVSQKAVGNLLENKVKNRYTNVIPYDHTRVVLKGVEPGKSNYINASYINGIYRENTFIAAQAPKKETLADFWRMIFFEKTPLVIMLTNLAENGKTKCVQYWPEGEEGDYGGFHVVIESTSRFVDFDKRKILVTYEKQTHSLFHFHFKTWPDHGCPECATNLLDFCHRIRKIVPYSETSTLLVHCSAGVGRTGTLILIDAILECIKRDDNIDIYEYFRSLRQDRMQMVQTPEQYLFVYKSIFEHLICGYTSMTIEEFSGKFSKITDPSILHDDFGRLMAVINDVDESQTVNALLSINLKKNVDLSILPRDTERVIISEDDEGSNYINAVFVHGHRNENLFIATQSPLAHTIKDFWLMVWSHKVSTIVYIMTQEELETFPRVITSEAEYECRDVLVSCVDKEEQDNCLMKKIKLITTDTESSVSMICIQNWVDKSVPDDPMMIIDVIDWVIKSQQNNENGCILVSCSDGGSRSGTFIACMNLIDQMKIESTIDVFQIVRRVKTVRPEFVANEEQYQFLYDVAKAYLKRFENYSNFIECSTDE